MVLPVFGAKLGPTNDRCLTWRYLPILSPRGQVDRHPAGAGPKEESMQKLPAVMASGHGLSRTGTQ